MNYTIPSPPAAGGAGLVAIGTGGSSYFDNPLLMAMMVMLAVVGMMLVLSTFWSGGKLVYNEQRAGVGPFGAIRRIEPPSSARIVKLTLTPPVRMARSVWTVIMKRRE